MLLLYSEKQYIKEATKYDELIIIETISNIVVGSKYLCEVTYISDFNYTEFAYGIAISNNKIMVEIKNWDKINFQIEFDNRKIHLYWR